MTTQWIGVLVIYGLTGLLAIQLGRYLAWVFKGDPNRTGDLTFDFMKPLERLIYRLECVDPTADLETESGAAPDNQSGLRLCCAAIPAKPAAQPRWKFLVDPVAMRCWRYHRAVHRD